MVVLQNFINLQELAPDSYSETCLKSHDRSQIINLKVEDMIDIQEEEDPVQIIKAEREVS